MAHSATRTDCADVRLSLRNAQTAWNPSGNSSSSWISEQSAGFQAQTELWVEQRSGDITRNSQPVGTGLGCSLEAFVFSHDGGSVITLFFRSKVSK